MPYLEIATATTPADPEALLKAANTVIAEVLGKSIDYCMARIDDGAVMAFGESNVPCAFLSVRAIDLSEQHAVELVGKLCNLMLERADIPPERCYVQFASVDRSLWGWNGKTFTSK